MPARARSSGSTPSSPLWRSKSPIHHPLRRTTPYSLRSLAHRNFNQTGPIEDSLFAHNNRSLLAFDSLPEDLSVERQVRSPAAPTSSVAGNVFNTNGTNSNESATSHTRFSASSTLPPSFSPVIDLSNSFFTGPPTKPQFLKKSPFASLAIRGINSTEGSNGGTGTAVAQQTGNAPTDCVSITPTPLTPTQAQDMYKKWAASFGVDKASILPSPVASPQNVTPPQQITRSFTSRTSSSASDLRFSPVAPKAPIVVNDQPINLSRPSSSVHSSSTSIVGTELPLDLRSPPGSRTTTPVTPSLDTPSFFAPRNETPPFSSASYFGKQQQLPNTPMRHSLQNHKFGINFQHGGEKSSFVSIQPPPPVSHVGTTPQRLFSMSNGEVPFNSAKTGAVSPTDMLQETTRKLHCMNLRSHKSQVDQQLQNAAAASANQQQINLGRVTSQAMEVGGGNRLNFQQKSPPVATADERNNRITLHYPTPPPEQQQLFGQRNTNPVIIKPQTLPPPPPISTFRGLSTKVIENSFSVMLTDKLEENYLKCRNLVMGKEGFLMTPLKFLGMLCNRMKLNIHAETFRFYSAANEVQYRTELYVGGFCGVGHAISIGFSKQLAAAHVLERMRIHFRGIKQTAYALFPGSRHTKIVEKLEALCKMYDLGEVQIVYKDRLHQQQQQNGNGGNTKRYGGWQGRDLEVRWECSCFVKKFQAIVLSDHMIYGGFQAAKDMYLSFVKPPEIPVVQIKDYFAVGVDCPMLKDIHCSLLLNRPSINKLQWMEEYQVPSTQLDAILHDPMNNSRYLMEQQQQVFSRRGNIFGGVAKRTNTLEGNKLAEFRRNLEEALEWIQATFRRNNLQGMRLRQGGRRSNPAAANATPMEEESDDKEVDENDAEVEDIFHDAIMDVEVI